MSSRQQKKEALNTGEKLVLKPEIIKLFLSGFKYTGDREGYQYTEMDMSQHCIEAVPSAIAEFKMVTKLNLSGNNVVDVQHIANLQNLTYLNLARNKVKNISIFANEENFPNLRWLDVSSNKFTEFPAFKIPKCDYLDISFNKLEKVNEGWAGHDNLKIIKSVDNKFKNLAPFKNLPRLEELYLAQNAISSFSGWENLPALKILHLRKNKVDKFEEELPELPALTVLNLRSNKVGDLEQVKRIMGLIPTLEDLNLVSNPIENKFSSFNLLIADVLIANPKLKRFSKTQIEDSHKLEAVYLAEYRWDEEEKIRIQKEKEEREKEEAENQ